MYFLFVVLCIAIYCNLLSYFSGGIIITIPLPVANLGGRGPAPPPLEMLKV